MSIADVVANYKQELFDLGVRCEVPQTKTDLGTRTRMSMYHGSEIPEDLVAVHDSFVSTSYCFVDHGVLIDWPDDARAALARCVWMAGTPVPVRKHIPTFELGEYVYTVVVDQARCGEVWRFRPDPDATDVVKVADSLGDVLGQWSSMVAQGVISLDDYGHLVPTNTGGVPLLERWPEVNILVLPYYVGGRFLVDRQAEAGVDRDLFESGRQAVLQAEQAVQLASLARNMD